MRFRLAPTMHGSRCLVNVMHVRAIQRGRLAADVCTFRASWHMPRLMHLPLKWMHAGADERTNSRSDRYIALRVRLSLKRRDELLQLKKINTAGLHRTKYILEHNNVSIFISTNSYMMYWVCYRHAHLVISVFEKAFVFIYLNISHMHMEFVD